MRSQPLFQEDTQVSFLDPRYKLLVYPDAPTLLREPARNERELEKAFEWLQATIWQRLDLLASRREKYVHSFNEQFPKEKIPYITVVATEMRDLDISGNSLLQRILLNNDNAGVYFLALTESSVEELDLGANNLMFNAMPFQDAFSLIPRDKA